MMDVVFFPFSHVDENQKNTLAAFFSHFWFLPLAADLNEDSQMKPLVEKNMATPVFTSSSDMGRVAPQVSAWLDWAALHQGNERNLKTLIRDNPYFTDGSGTAAIQSELRARMNKDTTDTEKKPKTVDPLLFLQIAKITDAKNEAIDLALAGVEKKQGSLFSQLRGDPDPVLPDTHGKVLRDPGEIMTLERMSAWAACARQEKRFQRQGSMVLVTTSSAVFEKLAAISTRVTNALDIDSIKVHEDGCKNKSRWQDRVLGILERLAAGPFAVDVKQIQTDLNTARDGCRLRGRIQAGVFSGVKLEKQLNLPAGQLVVCRVAVKT
jgi:hypothetical protein